MTWNLLRQEWAREGWPVWEERVEEVVPVIRRERPDVVAIQEETPGMVESLLMRLDGYRYETAPPEPQSGSGLLIATSRVEVLDRDRVALPFDRAVTLLKLGTEEGVCWVGSTHFTPFPERLADRTASAAALAEWAREVVEPVVVMGDFNSLPADPAVALLLREGFRDAFSPGEASVVDFVTAAEHPERSDGFRLDYIWVRGRVRVDEAYVPGFPPTASDHHPLLAVLLSSA